MAEENKKKKKKLLPLIIILGVLVLGGVSVGLGIGLSKNQPQPQPTETETETEPETTEAEKNWLVEALGAEGDSTIEVNEDVTLPEIAFVVGKKTITGTGKISGASGEEYIIVVNEGASLILDGATLDGTDGAKNGVYVSNGAEFELKNGGIQNVQGHALRVLNTATVSGGTIDTCGENFVMVDANAKLNVTGGEMKGAKGVGIITGEGSETTLSKGAKIDGAEANIVSNAGTLTIDGAELLNAEDYTVLNTGKVTVKNTTFTGNQTFGYFQNEAGGVIEIADSEMKDSKGDYVYNMGEITMENITFGTCGSNAFENKGNEAVFTLKNATMESIGRGAFLNRAGTMNIESVTVTECGEFLVHNRAGIFNGKDIKADKVGGIAFFNDFAADKDNNDIKDLFVDGFEIGFADNYGVRNSGGTMVLSNGTMGKCTSYGLYVYDGDVTVNGCKFLGTNDPTRGVIQIGLSTRQTGKLTVNDTEITGGARGITNQSELVFNSGKIYGCKSAGNTTVGAGINNIGTATINGGTITQNISISSGGAIYNQGNMTINNLIVTGNRSQASGGGVAGKGALIINNIQITNNVCANYGAGLYNTGSLTFKGGVVQGNKAGKGGGGMHNSGAATVVGGKFTNNTVGEDKNGANIYNSGSLTLAGGNLETNEAKPYDLYIYKGNVNIQGSPKLLSVYKATEGTLTISNTVKTENIRFYANSYAVGTQALIGKPEKIATSNTKFVLPDTEVALEKYINEEGVITMEGIDLSVKEAQLIRDGEVIEEGAFLLAMKSAKNGDTIKLIDDVTIKDTVEFSQNRQVTLTDDGTKRTVTFETVDKAGIYVFGAVSTETRCTVSFVGTEEGGLEFVGCEANTAQILLSDFATLNVNGNVTFKNFKNVATEGSSSKSGRTSKRYGSLFFVFNVGTANLMLDGTTVTDCTSANGRGAVIYLQTTSGTTSLKNVTVKGENAINTSATCGVEIGGLVKIDGIYLAKPMVIAEALAEGSEIKVNLENYAENEKVYESELGADAIKTAVGVTTILNSAEEDPAQYLLGDNGIMYQNPEALVEKEAELYDENNVLVSTAGFTTQISAAKNGYTVKLISDVEITEPLAIGAKTIRITDDGTRRKIILADPTACFHCIGTGSSKLCDVTIEGTTLGGLTITCKDGVKLTTAAILAWKYSNVKVQKNVTLTRIVNEAVDTAKNESGMTSGSLGAVFFVNASNSAHLTVDSVTIVNCSCEETGTVLYNLGYDTTMKNCTISNNKCKAGYALYNDNTGSGDGRVLNLESVKLSGNRNSDDMPADIFNGGLLTVNGTVVAEKVYLQKPMTVGAGLHDSSHIKVAMESFTAGTKVLTGDTGNVQSAVQRDLIVLLDNEGKAADEITLNLADSGLLVSTAPVLLYEAEALDGTTQMGTGSLSDMLNLAATNGYTVVLKKDAELTSAFTAISKGKEFTLKDDGKAHTVTITPDGSKAAFFLWQKSGAKTVFNIQGSSEGGLTFQGAEGAEFKSAAFVVCQYSELNVSGNVTVQNFKNVATGTTAPNNTNCSSAGRGAAFAQASSGSAFVTLNGITIKNCETKLGGAGYYCNNWNSSLFDVTITGCKAGQEGGGIYVCETSSGSTRKKLVMIRCTVTGNTSTAIGNDDVTVGTDADLIFDEKQVIGELMLSGTLTVEKDLTEGSSVGLKLESYTVDSQVVKLLSPLGTAASIPYFQILGYENTYKLDDYGVLTAK